MVCYLANQMTGNTSKNLKNTIFVQVSDLQGEKKAKSTNTRYL
jgi:hypothetical protein